jgi:hypothetical protein
MYIRTSDQEKVNMGFGDFQCNWGLHLAGLYETEAERDEIIFGYFEQGIKEGDLQLYCPTERSRDDFVTKFSNYCPECGAAIDNPDKMVLSSTRELYYPSGVFSPWDMDDGLNDFFIKSQAKGKRNIRATAEMVWALDDAIPGKEHLMAYESRLNYFIPGKPWISICLYNVTKFTGDVIMDVLRTHPYTLNGGIITQNPYYINPDEYLARFAPQFLDKNRKD